MGKLTKATQRRVTIKDIAAMARVSIGTVDRVLHNRGEVNQATHERVMSFVDELGYTPNLLAKSLALKKSFTIAVLIPDAGANNPYWKKPLAGFKSASEELHDFNTKIVVLNYDAGEEKSFVKEFNRMLALKPDGLILAPVFHDAAENLIPICKERDIPYIFIDNDLEHGKGLAYFGQDALQSGTVAAKLMHYGLPEQATVLILNLAGNKAITRHMQRREQGFISFFLKEIPEKKIYTLSCAIDLSQKQEPEKTLHKLLQNNPGIAGIFVTNSRVHKVAKYFALQGKGTLALIGYDMVDANVKYMEQGIIDFLICQKPEDQGYRSAMAMFNFLLTGRQPDKINYSPIDIITKENIHYYNNNR